MRNSVVLNQVFEDPVCAILFEMEYVISVPIHVNILNTIKKKNIAETKKQYETHHILVRWGAYSPYANNSSLNEASRCEVSLFGGSGIDSVSPEFKLLYKKPNTNMHDKLSSVSAPGKISFSIESGNQINFKARQPDQRHRQTPSDVSNSQMYDKSHQASHQKMPQQRQQPIQMDNAQFMDTSRSMHARGIFNQMMPHDENLQTSQANLLMNQLLASQQMDLSRSQQMIGVFGGSLELYPIYNQSLHMPVMALSPGQIGGRTMSRAAYAKLQSAKFPPITDRYGKPAEVVDGNSYTKFSLQSEESDMLSCNQICIQFLAFSRTLDAIRSGKSDPKPQRVFLTFQFYRFPEFTTPHLMLDQIIEDYSINPECTPFILKTDLKNPKSGYMVCYNVDPTNLKYGEKKLFLQYLAHHAMFIDVWDADSLHLIGTATLQLKELLRQGRDAVQSTYELNILNTEFDDDEQRVNSGQVFREGTPYTSDSHIKLKGMLHVRIGNVGIPYEDINGKNTAWNLLINDKIHQTLKPLFI